MNAQPTTVSGPDQTERAILAAAEETGPGCPCDVIVIGDATGTLTATALDWTGGEGGRVWSWTRSRARATALAAQFPADVAAQRLTLPAGPDPVPLKAFFAGADAHLVIGRLPKGLAALETLARELVAYAQAADRTDLEVILGDRVKHMSRSQNAALATCFDEVRAARGVGKSRALVASSPRAEGPAAQDPVGPIPVTIAGTERELVLQGGGGVFGGAKADAGSLLLLAHLDRAVTAGEVTATRAVDLGSGNGVLTAYLAAAFPEALVLGSDDDADAVRSTRATLAANHLERPNVRITWDDALAEEPDTSTDLLLLNPPFHDGTGIDATLVQHLLDAAARVLAPGGQLWFVHNSHLRYRGQLEARFTQVRERARDRRFTVLSAVRP